MVSIHCLLLASRHWCRCQHHSGASGPRFRNSRQPLGAPDGSRVATTTNPAVCHCFRTRRT